MSVSDISGFTSLEDEDEGDGLEGDLDEGEEEEAVAAPAPPASEPAHSKERAELLAGAGPRRPRARADERAAPDTHESVERRQLFDPHFKPDPAEAEAASPSLKGYIEATPGGAGEEAVSSARAAAAAVDTRAKRDSKVGKAREDGIDDEFADLYSSDEEGSYFTDEEEGPKEKEVDFFVICRPWRGAGRAL